MDNLEAEEQELLNYYRDMNNDFKAILMAVAKQNAAASKILDKPALKCSA